MTKVYNWNFQNRVGDFWIKTRNEYPIISDLAIHKLLAVCTTFLCEQACSKLINLSFLKNVENALRPPLSCIKVRMDDLCKNHRMASFHYLCLITSINWIVYC